MAPGLVTSGLFIFKQLFVFVVDRMGKFSQRHPMTATLTKLTKGFSQKNFDRYVAQHMRAMLRARDKGHRDFKNMSYAEIEKAAQFLARTNNAGEIWT